MSYLFISDLFVCVSVSMYVQTKNMMNQTMIGSSLQLTGLLCSAVVSSEF